MVEIKEQLSIVDFRGTEVGMINAEIIPCSSQSKEYTEVTFSRNYIRIFLISLFQRMMMSSLIVQVS